MNRASLAVKQAKAYASLPIEQALINALQFRYPETRDMDCSIWNQNYAKAMGSVYEQFGDDLDVAALYADALMNLTPWQMWDIRSGRPSPGARTMEVKSVLDRALAGSDGLKHPGLLHLYIHLMEMVRILCSPNLLFSKSERLPPSYETWKLLSIEFLTPFESLPFKFPNHLIFSFH